MSKKRVSSSVSLSDSPAPRCSSLARVKPRSRLDLFPFHVVPPLSHSQSCWPLLPKSVQNPVPYHDPHPHLPLFGARRGEGTLFLTVYRLCRFFYERTPSLYRDPPVTYQPLPSGSSLTPASWLASASTTTPHLVTRLLPSQPASASANCLLCF